MRAFYRQVVFIVSVSLNFFFFFLNLIHYSREFSYLHDKNLGRFKDGVKFTNLEFGLFTNFLVIIIAATKSSRHFQAQNYNVRLKKRENSKGEITLTPLMSCYILFSSLSLCFSLFLLVRGVLFSRHGNESIHRTLSLWFQETRT